ncbi:MAG: hypothetical protein R6V27_16695 [Balneolaceae bacterium]
MGNVGSGHGEISLTRGKDELHSGPKSGSVAEMTGRLGVCICICIPYSQLSYAEHPIRIA